MQRPEQTDQTFLFADLAGFTALTEVHGDDAAADAVVEFCADVRAVLPQFDGEEIKSIGDAEMVRIPDAGQAIELAVCVIREIGAQHGSLAVRVGAHTGPAVKRGDDWFGAAVNLASRVADAAERGEILMTDATRAAAGRALDPYEIEPRGEREFKNVAEPIEVFALKLSSQSDVADLPIDPVCRMAIQPDRSAARRSRGDATFYFCSMDCAEVFDRDPRRYIADPAAGGEDRPAAG